MSQSRLLSCHVLYQVCHKQVHIKQALAQVLPADLSSQDKAWIQNTCYQTLRNFQQMEDRWKKFIYKPVKDQLIAILLTMSVAQKFILNKPDHAIVNEAVNVSKKLKKQWASGLVNGILKKVLNDIDYQPAEDTTLYNHPQWWIDCLKKDWPDHYLDILQANNQKPPLWLRLSDTSVTKPPGRLHPYLSLAWLCDEKTADITQHLNDGLLSVQDAAAQWAATLLQPKDNEQILDACAAPGGKTCHLLQMNPSIRLDVIEKEPERMRLIMDNLSRLDLQARRLIIGDASDPKQWHTGQAYDAILLDVPCSASGVVRRNPDIKILRQPEHLTPLTDLQQSILQTNAKILKIGGRLLYVTCSVFKVENEHQIRRFLRKNPNFKPMNFEIPDAVSCQYGQQIITGTNQQDGFYYCLLERQS